MILHSEQVTFAGLEEVKTLAVACQDQSVFLCFGQKYASELKGRPKQSRREGTVRVMKNSLLEAILHTSEPHKANITRKRLVCHWQVARFAADCTLYDR